MCADRCKSKVVILHWIMLRLSLASAMCFMCDRRSTTDDRESLLCFFTSFACTVYYHLCVFSLVAVICVLRPQYSLFIFIFVFIDKFCVTSTKIVFPNLLSLVRLFNRFFLSCDSHSIVFHNDKFCFACEILISS